MSYPPKTHRRRRRVPRWQLQWFGGAPTAPVGQSHGLTAEQLTLTPIDNSPNGYVQTGRVLATITLPCPCSLLPLPCNACAAVHSQGEAHSSR